MQDQAWSATLQNTAIINVIYNHVYFDVIGKQFDCNVTTVMSWQQKLSRS